MRCRLLVPEYYPFTDVRNAESYIHNILYQRFVNIFGTYKKVRLLI